MRKLLSTLLLAILISAALQITTSANPVISNETKEHIMAELNRAKIPNAAIAIIQNGETSYVLKDSNHDTLFPIGSVTKSFTGFGVLLLEDMGLLSVSDSVRQHLSWFEVRYNGEFVPHEDIAVYNLLQHTSGFTSDERRFPSTVNELSQGEFIEQLRGIELVFYPSQGHVYGNVNYIILGLLIEAVSGQSYDEFITQNVLHPLGLYNTFTNGQHARATGRAVDGHRYGFFRPRRTDAQWASLAVPTGGGVYSTISNMVRWAKIQLGEIEVNEQLTRVIARSHENNHTTQNPFADLDFVYAAGWGVSDEGFIQHVGSTMGNISAVWIVTEDDLAVVILSNLRQNVAPWVFMVLDAVNEGELNHIGADANLIMDIIFVGLTAIGVLFIGLLIRLAIKVGKRMHSREKSKHMLKIRWLFGLLPSIIGVLFFYIIAPMLFAMPLGALLIFSPASTVTAIVAVWIMAVYSTFSLLAKVLFNK